MTAPEPPLSSRTARREANRRRNRRIAIIVAAAVVVLGAGAAAALTLGGDDGGDDSERSSATRRSTTTTSAATTTVPETAPADPAACLRGRFRFVSQVYSGPVNTTFGPVNIAGGEEGRTIELRPDGTFHFEDDGREQVNIEVLNLSTTGTAELKATAEGTYTADATSGNFDVTQLAGSLTVTLADGSVFDIPLPPDAAGVEETFGLTGGATYTCEGDRVTVQFTNVTVVLERLGN